MQGEVHDPRAYRLGGVAGHAGLFSTAEDLAVYAQMMLQQGTYARRAHPQSRDGPHDDAGLRSVRRAAGLGWDKRSGYSSNRAELFTDRAYGHGGFTGTVIWIDPGLDLFFIFLSNRVHPDGKGNVNSLGRSPGHRGRSRFSDRCRGTSTRLASPARPLPKSANVRTGLDRLQQDGWQLLAGQRVGLITNHTGIDHRGRSNIQLLRDAPQVNLVALFSPEHGLAGQLDQSSIDDSTDARRGLRMLSLYGKTANPRPNNWQQVDTLVFDIQDIGTRFYTYVSTMGLAMQAAAEHHKRFVVLDRPNPINGVDVDGPILDEGRQSFVGFHTLPVRHGMTVGELARMFQRGTEAGGRPARGAHAGMAASAILRRHRTDLGQSVAQHAESEPGLAVSRNRPVGNHEPVRRARNRHAVRADRCPLAGRS